MARTSLDSADHPNSGAFTVTTEFGQFLEASLSTTLTMFGLKRNIFIGKFLQGMTATMFKTKFEQT